MRHLTTLDAEKSVKSLCGAKPPQKLHWTNAGGFGDEPIGYGDFTADARCRGGLVCLSRRFARVATTSSPVRTATSGWPASSLGST
jgi:hypothetical protein